MGSPTLARFVEDVRSVPFEQYDELFRECRDLAVRRLDVRYMVLAECFDLAVALPGGGEAAAFTVELACALMHAWEQYVRAILALDDEEAATALALALRNEITVLTAGDPASLGQVGRNRSGEETACSRPPRPATVGSEGPPQAHPRPTEGR